LPNAKKKADKTGHAFRPERSGDETPARNNFGTQTFCARPPGRIDDAPPVGTEKPL
jgi:hypothetical protein